MFFLLVVLTWRQGLSQEGTKEVRLGRSHYFITLPTSWKLSEARGKEAQLGYNIFNERDRDAYWGLVEIKPGRPTGGPLPFPTGVADSLAAEFLGQPVVWIIDVTAWGFEARVKQADISGQIRAKQRADLERMVKVFGTLVKK